MRYLSTSASALEEKEIIERTLAGDRNAFALLLQKYQVSLFDMACRILGNRADAEDVLQDAFLEAYRHLADFNHEARFSTWLYSIVLNRVRNHLRHAKIIRWRSLDGSPVPRDDARAPEMPEKGPPFHLVMEHELELEALKREVRTLSPLYQSIFVLHYFQDMSLEEVSRRLNRPLGTVKVYLHRARKILYKRFYKTNPGIRMEVSREKDHITRKKLYAAR